MPYLAGANALLLVLFPVAWAAPLVRAGLLPLFGLSEISMLSGIATLWRGDPALALLVALLALVAPIAKTLCLLTVQLGRAPARLLPPLAVLGRLAMADVFLIAVYVTIARGTGFGRIEVAWGLYLFTFCVFLSILLAHLTAARLRRDAIDAGSR